VADGLRRVRAIRYELTSTYKQERPWPAPLKQ